MDWRINAGAAAAALLALLRPAAGPAARGAGPLDGLKVIFCGTSGPLPVEGPRQALRRRSRRAATLYLVDVGPEATENLMLWRMPMATAKAVFLTHLHSDHIGDLGEFNLQSWVAGRPAPLALVGPPGVEQGRRGLQRGLRARPRLPQGPPRARRGQVLPIAAGLLKAQVVPVPTAARGTRRGLGRRTA